MSESPSQPTQTRFSKIKQSFWFWLLLSWGFILLLWIFTPWLVGNMAKDDARGIFGDQFGYINALFSGMALAAITISLWYQREDIKINQQALLDQKSVFEKQLRLAATTEIVASLPIISFDDTRNRSGSSGRCLIYNTGPEVYDVSVFKYETLLLTRLGGITVWKKGARLPLEEFPHELILAFNLRNGEPVSITYQNVNTSDVYMSQKPWCDIIKDVLDKSMSALAPEKNTPKA